TSALLLTKVNIGVFVLFSALGWWLLHHRSDVIRRWSMLLVSGGAIAMMFSLMGPLLGTAWVQTFAFVFAFSGMAVFLATTTTATAMVSWPVLRHFAVWGCGVGGGIL